MREDILVDRAELDALIGRVGGSTGTGRAAVGWLVEKAARLKLRMDDAAEGDFRLLEAVELVAVGIDGKRALLLALAEVPKASPRLPFSHVPVRQNLGVHPHSGERASGDGRHVTKDGCGIGAAQRRGADSRPEMHHVQGYAGF